mmetsp:Transcript_39402/g.75496  ORF Transcript_39402/g.75496 Transcript_39402/m.75496 type:complete len:281 (+) Transcript_39402:200-1042(+)|eukprot:CAMPEP_0114249876 /NCGR_PEP_ID=MMETSP0058-20121206/14394_1 /TAXON_ID=36894 /ORGANISM="Pyramimonas parkeae, CCMP726" /LENGTH=280 /DNA_ID=CAMNT_0001363487 /DNA_START=169 /DNA_END=1011 /DNA_ORIENTATION=-
MGCGASQPVAQTISEVTKSEKTVEQKHTANASAPPTSADAGKTGAATEVEEEAAAPNSVNSNHEISAELKKVYGFVPVPYIRNVFADYDTNQDGTLQANELREFLKDLGEDPSPSDVESAIQAMGDANGRVTFDVFMEWYTEDYSQKQVYAVFVKYDADGSGLLSPTELRMLLKDLCESNDDDSVQGVLDLCDTNSDNVISYNEFFKYFNGNWKLARLSANFQQYDLNGDGSLGVKEVQKLLKSIGLKGTKQQAIEVIDQLDTNSNKKVEFQEFLKWAAE